MSIADNQIDLATLKLISSSQKIGLSFIETMDHRVLDSSYWLVAMPIISYLKTYKDTPTLEILLDRDKEKKLHQNFQHLWSQFEEIKVDQKEYPIILEKLKERFAQQQLSLAREVLSRNNLSSKQILAEINKVATNIDKIENHKTYDAKSLKEHLPTFIDTFNAKKNDPDFDRGMITGFSFLDWATNGIKPSDMVIVAGETGQGKSVFLNSLAKNVWLGGSTPENPLPLKGKNIIYFSLEMPYDDCFYRVLSAISKIPFKKIENANLSKDEKITLRKWMDFIHSYEHTFDIVDIPRMAKAKDIEQILIEKKLEKPIDGIFVDYLGIMLPNKDGDQDWLSQSIIAYELREVARAHQIPMFSAVQLNRKDPAKDKDNLVGLHRLARSSGIATHCTTIIQLDPPTLHQLNGKGSSPLIQSIDQSLSLPYHIIKNRKGPQGKGNLIRQMDCACFEDDPSIFTEDEYQFADVDDISEDIDL